MKCPHCGCHLSIPVARLLDVERFKSVLELTQGSRTRTAEVLGVSLRTVRNWIRLLRVTDNYEPPKSTAPRRRHLHKCSWTTFEERTMISLGKAGASWEEIGAVLKRTPEACRHHARRMLRLKQEREMRDAS